MRFGHFDDENREYVIERPDTPLPWINYLGCESYLGIISNTAGGYSFFEDARLRRISRYRYNNVPLDFGGRYIYLRDGGTGEFWSNSWQPVRSDLDEYECRHGMGYTKISSVNKGIAASAVYFVPLGENLEIWQLTVTNRRRERADVSVFSSIEFALWDADDDANNLQRNLNIGEVEVEDGVIYHKTEYRERRNHYSFFACSAPLAGFDTSRDAFLGPYDGWDEPAAVAEGKSRDSIAHGWAPIGSHHVALSLKPGESKQIIYVLGYQENPQDEKFDPPGSQTVNKKAAKPLIEKYLDPGNVDAAFTALRSHWDRLLGILQVETPDVHLNRMVNIWNAYQTMVTFNLSRSASQFETGVGRGMGFRDSNQDLLASVQQVPERSRERILDLAATQLESGGAYHQYQPLTKKGNDAIGGGFNDDPLWLVLATAAYLKETGDWSILDEVVTYESRPGTEQPLYEHLQRAVQYTLDRLGPHGLPLIGRADWNDCMNLNIFSEHPGDSFQTAPLAKDGTVAESVFIGGLFVKAALELARISERHSLQEQAGRYLAEAAKMEATVLEHGWDGEWFLRAYDALGHKVGSSECEEGQIFIEPQGICTLAGIGLDTGQARKALDSARNRLATRHGLLLHQPAFTRYYLHMGEISSYPPGYKENAGVFCQTNPWVMIGETRLGEGDQAFDYYTRINPSAREEISEVHRCEPYVYAQMIAGRDAPTHGEAKNSWLTGTAAWSYVSVTQWILGIRPTLDGLRIAPVIPKDWPGFKAARLFRGVRYEISVERKGKGNEVSLTVDGQPVKGNVVPPPGDGCTEVKVEAELS
jgi:cellobiose phosphorylase